MSPTKVVVVHEYELARRGLRRMLEPYEDVEVVGEASGAQDALEMAATVSPDVILMAAELPGVSGLDTLLLLRRRGLGGSVIVLSEDDRALQEAMKTGAGGYAVETAEAEELASLIRRVPEGGFAFGASVMMAAKGKDVALKYVAQPVEAPAPAPVPVPQPVAGEMVMAAEIVIPPPLDPVQLIGLQQWLSGTAKADIDSTEGHWQSDTVVRVSFRQPTPLVPWLKALPFVADAKDEGPAVVGDSLARFVTRLGGTQKIGVGQQVPRRVRLQFKGK